MGEDVGLVSEGRVAPVTVTVTTLDVDDGYVPLPPKVAVTEFPPDWNEDAGTDVEQVPPLSVQEPTTVIPALKLTVPASAGGVSTYPVGVPPVTVAFNVVDCPEEMVVGLAVSAVLLVNAVFHLEIRLLTFNEPRPVTWSKPMADW
jgi:hypothetical protein